MLPSSGSGPPPRRVWVERHYPHFPGGNGKVKGGVFRDVRTRPCRPGRGGWSRGIVFPFPHASLRVGCSGVGCSGRRIQELVQGKTRISLDSDPPTTSGLALGGSRPLTSSGASQNSGANHRVSPHHHPRLSSRPGCRKWGIQLRMWLSPPEAPGGGLPTWIPTSQLGLLRACCFSVPLWKGTPGLPWEV